MAEFSLDLMRSPESTKIYRDRGKMFRILLLAVPFAGLCSFFFWKEAMAGRIPPLKEYLGWFAFVVIWIMIPAFAVKMLDSRPALEFSDAGLRARDIAADVIPWSVIRAASKRSLRRQPFVELHVDQEVVLGLHPNFLQSKTRFINRALGFNHYNITASMLDHDADFILQLINHYLQKTRSAETSVT
jgi:hypothetical protein